MSKVSSKINQIKRKLDLISGLDDDVILNYVNKIYLMVDMTVKDIDLYLKEDGLNGTVFSKNNRRDRGVL